VFFCLSCWVVLWCRLVGFWCCLVIGGAVRGVFFKFFWVFGFCVFLSFVVFWMVVVVGGFFSSCFLFECCVGFYCLFWFVFLGGFVVCRVGWSL